LQKALRFAAGVYMWQDRVIP